MKNILIVIFLLSGFGLLAQDFNVITYNIRNNNPNNDDGENAWPLRKELVCQLLRFHDAGIFGLQEALADQVQYMSSEFKDFKWIGVGRDDGKDAGEFAPIFYNPKLFNLDEKGWFWLSETPERPGKGWDADCVRICTWGKFTQKVTGKKFMLFNTHFDHRGMEARIHSVDLVLQKMNDLNTEKLPSIFMGDLNMTPELVPIATLKKHLHDSKEISSEAPYGPEGTTNDGFNFLSELTKRIDYIFVNDQVDVLKYAVLSDSKNRHYFSDHLPVFVKLKLK